MVNYFQELEDLQQESKKYATMLIMCVVHVACIIVLVISFYLQQSILQFLNRTLVSNHLNSSRNTSSMSTNNQDHLTDALRNLVGISIPTIQLETGGNGKVRIDFASL